MMAVKSMRMEQATQFRNAFQARWAQFNELICSARARRILYYQAITTTAINCLHPIRYQVKWVYRATWTSSGIAWRCRPMEKVTSEAAIVSTNRYRNQAHQRKLRMTTGLRANDTTLWIDLLECSAIWARQPIGREASATVNNSSRIYWIILLQCPRNVTSTATDHHLPCTIQFQMVCRQHQKWDHQERLKLKL